MDQALLNVSDQGDYDEWLYFSFLVVLAIHEVVIWGSGPLPRPLHAVPDPNKKENTG